ncbi:MAG: DUF6526 family protein [Bryobacteraceae bacterium]|nr:DUF6526 family protein [Bryobacteraceae bacterium]
MSEVAQNFQNHVRREPLFTYIVVPLLLIHFAHVVVRLSRNLTMDNVDAALLGFALIVMALLTRVNALKPQDRIIRLEEQLRYQRVLSPELAAKSAALTRGQIIALRFASDAELPGLVTQTLAGQFAKPVEIKKAIRNWRPDNSRI